MSRVDCTLTLNADGFFECPDCNWIYKRKADKPPRRNCPASPDVTEAAERLGITGDDIKHWTQALARWASAGFQTRSQADVERIEAEHCRPCDQYTDGRCKQCGCRVNKSRVAVANKIKLETESCPLEKWGSPEQPNR